MNNIKKFILLLIILVVPITTNISIAEDMIQNPKPIIKITNDQPAQTKDDQIKVLDAEYKCVYPAGSCTVSLYNGNTRRSARCDYSVSPRKAIIDALDGKCEKIK